MNTLNYKVNFHYIEEKSKTDISKMLNAESKDKLNSIFVYLREQLIEKLNPMYDRWNKEYDKLYPEKDNHNEEDFKYYTKWIINKQQPYVDEINNKFGNVAKLFLNEEESGDIEMKVQFDNVTIIVFAELTPM